MHRIRRRRFERINKRRRASLRSLFRRVIPTLRRHSLYRRRRSSSRWDDVKSRPIFPKLRVALRREGAFLIELFARSVKGNFKKQEGCCGGICCPALGNFFHYL
ncbi:hypothetical protein GWI33_014251 [Rhynchophorus ferrugineus]|uniref:Uncharacterized protein n=1 Tax=Rhynchophorus ferrugineus TaxID=354439 RepID=A0A834MAU2_RHYFE|nr:hypothetical protein GWI33_014251 [Rhynchophorus ferrugineus]